jgi:hypothetical protein
LPKLATRPDDEYRSVLSHLAVTPDRDVLILRHFEEPSNAEAAQVLGIRPSAADRSVRALKRHKAVFPAWPGGIEGL